MFVSEDFGTMNGQWVRVPTLTKGLESTERDIACISHIIRSILQLFLFDIAPNLLTLRPSETIITNKTKKGKYIKTKIYVVCGIRHGFLAES